MQAQDAHEQQHVDAPAPAVDSDAHEASASSGGSTLIGEHSVQAESGETHAEQEQDVVLEQEQSVIVMTGQQAAHHRVALACLLEDAGFAILRQSRTSTHAAEPTQTVRRRADGTRVQRPSRLAVLFWRSNASTRCRSSLSWPNRGA